MRRTDRCCRSSTREFRHHCWRDFLQKRNRRANLSGRAVTALKSVLLDECGLHGMQAVTVRESFDSGDFIAFVHHCERETGIDASPIY